MDLKLKRQSCTTKFKYRRLFIMERHAFAMKVKSGKMNDYRKKLGEIWPDLTTFLDRNKVKNLKRIWVLQLINT